MEIAAEVFWFFRPTRLIIVAATTQAEWSIHASRDWLCCQSFASRKLRPMGIRDPLTPQNSRLFYVDLQRQYVFSVQTTSAGVLVNNATDGFLFRRRIYEI